MSTATTTAGWALPWDEPPGEGQDDHPGLCVAWDLGAPSRVGEVARIAGAAVLGRGGGDGADVVTFARERPGVAAAGAPLTDQRLSRRQLVLTPRDDGRLSVENVGKCPLLVNGQVTTTAVVGPGDTLMLRNVLVLLVVQRPRPRALQAYPARLAFPFGAADAHGMVGESPLVWRLRDELAVAATSRGHVLLLGRSGSGKELAARALHAMSARAGRELLSRNAATFPDTLVDAELFGNVKNYPNPGMAERRGLIGDADGTTLFLDEIGELPAQLSAHLLRVMDSGGEYQRLGDSRTARSDVRVVAATNRAVSELKHDFAARFTTRITLPPLDARREDVPLLVRALLDRRTREVGDTARFLDRAGTGDASPRVDPSLVEALLRHEYRTDHRELERLLWIACASSTGSFVALTPEVTAELELSSPGDTPARSGEIGADAIEAALAATGGNVTAAARALGLRTRFQLYRLMKEHGVSRAQEPGDDD